MATTPKSGDDDVTVKDAQALPDPAAEAKTQETPVAPAPSGGDAEDDEAGDEAPGAPPDADVVALRALALGALLRRLEMEQRTAPLKEIESLQAWVDEHGLYAHFGSGAFDLFDAAPSEWTDEDRAHAAWVAEELYVLRWALGQLPLPDVFSRADASAALEGLPLLAVPDTFTSKAERRPLELVEAQQVFQELLYDAAQTEAWARTILAAPEFTADDPDLYERLQEAAADGFELADVTRRKGAQAAAVEGLRWLTRQLLLPLFESGSPHVAQAFEPGKLATLPDESLALVLATARLRSDALAWLTEGDEEVEDDAGA